MREAWEPEALAASGRTSAMPWSVEMKSDLVSGFQPMPRILLEGRGELSMS